MDYPEHEEESFRGADQYFEKLKNRKGEAVYRRSNTYYYVRGWPISGWLTISRSEYLKNRCRPDSSIPRKKGTYL